MFFELCLGRLRHRTSAGFLAWLPWSLYQHRPSMYPISLYRGPEIVEHGVMSDGRRIRKGGESASKLRVGIGASLLAVRTEALADGSVKA